MPSVQPLSAQLSSVSNSLYASSSMARNQAFGPSAMQQQAGYGYQLMPPDPFAGSPSGSAYETMMMGNRATAAVLGAQAFQEAAMQQQSQEFLVNLGASVAATAAAAIPAGFLASGAVYMGTEMALSAIAREAGMMDQDPVVSYENQMRAMASGTVHQLAFQTPIPGFSRGVSMGTANRWGEQIYDQMRESGFQGGEIGRIASVMQQSGALEGIGNYEEMLDKLERYIERIAQFARNTGMSIEQTGSFMGMATTSGATLEEMMGTVSAIQNVAYRTDVPGEQLMQMGAQALGPWASMGLNYNQRAQSIIGNIGTGRDAMSTSGDIATWQQAGGWQQVAFTYEAMGSQVMASPTALRWLGAEGPGALDAMLSGAEMPENVQSRISGMSREERALAEWRGAQTAALSPDQWGDVAVAQMVGSLGRADVSNFDAVAWEMYRGGAYETPALARSALEMHTARTDPGASVRSAMDIYRDRQMLQVATTQNRALSAFAVATTLGSDDRSRDFSEVMARVAADPQGDYAAAFADYDGGRYLARVQEATADPARMLAGEAVGRGQNNIATIVSMVNAQSDPQARRILAEAYAGNLVGADIGGRSLLIDSEIIGANVSDEGYLTLTAQYNTNAGISSTMDIGPDTDVSQLGSYASSWYISDTARLGAVGASIGGVTDVNMAAAEGVDLSWVTASGADRLMLETLSAQGRSDLFNPVDAMSADNGFVRAQRVLRFAQDQMSPTELRDTHNLLNPVTGSDPAWNDLKTRLERTPMAWNVEGLDSGDVNDRFEAANRFVQALYGDETATYDGLDPDQKRAVNYYIGSTYSDWGMSDEQALFQGNENMLDMAGRTVEQAGAREALAMTSEDREAGMRRMRTRTGLSEEQLGAVSEYMVLENELRRLQGQGSRTTEENARLEDVGARIQEMNRDTSLFEGSSVGVAAERYGIAISQVGSDFSATGNALMGALAITQGTNLLQAHQEIVAQVSQGLGAGADDSAMIGRMVSGGRLTLDEISRLEGMEGAPERLIADLREDQKLDDFDILEQEYQIQLNQGDAAAISGRTAEGAVGGGSGQDPGSPLYVTVVGLPEAAAFRAAQGWAGQGGVTGVIGRLLGGDTTPTAEGDDD